MTRPVLLVGVPRSGSSWVLKVLGRTQHAIRFNEPDNEHRHVQALRAKRGLGRFPVLAPGDDAPSLDGLWEGVFTGRAASPSRTQRWANTLYAGVPQETVRDVVDRGPTSLRMRAAVALAALPHRERSAPDAIPVARSVHSAFAIDRIVERWDPQIVLVARDPRNVIASWLTMDIADRDRGFDRSPRIRARVLEPLGLPLAPSDDDPTRRAAWHFGVLWSALDRAAARHPGWVFVSHEALCEDPHRGLRAAADAAGLAWSAACDDYLELADAEGSGYDQHRVAADLPGRWRQRLTPTQIDAIAGELDRFPASTAGRSAPRVERRA